MAKCVEVIEPDELQRIEQIQLAQDGCELIPTNDGITKVLCPR
jgi:hypothetical protein